MNCHRPLAIGLAVVVVLSALAPLGAAVAGQDDGLDVAVTQDDEQTVTVTDNGSPVAGANVSVSTAAAGPGDAEDPANETVDENESANESADENDSSDDAYVGVGHYTTDENGTVALPEPETTVVVHVTASADNASGSTITTLEGTDGDENESAGFGATVSAMISDYEGAAPLGFAVATYVVSNNPGNAPGHAGPPTHVGPSGDDNETAGPPAHAGGSDDGDDGDDGDDDEDGNASDGERGPPEHAGGPNDGGNEGGEDDGKSAGPPEHAGGPGDDPDATNNEDDEKSDENANNDEVDDEDD